MKKLLKILIVVFAVSVLALTLVACSDPCADGHAWDKGTVNKAATCTEKGEMTYKCLNCDETKTEEIAALNHDWDLENKTGDTATCTQPGTATVSCKRTGCNATDQVATEALGHDWNGTWTTTATCLQDGTKTLVCLRTDCDDRSDTGTKTENDPALGHQWDEGSVTTDPTCTAAGVKTFTCTRTGCDGTPSPATKTEPVEALGHEYAENKCVRFDVCGHEMSEADVLAAFNALEKPAEPAYGASVTLLKGTFKLTGEITKIVTAYSANYGNITVDINVNGTTIQAYRMVAGEGVEGIATLSVGDTITVVGTLKHFYGSSWVAEFDSGCLLKSVTKVQRTVTWTYDIANTTVALADGTATLPTMVDGGSSVSFKVTPAEGKQVLYVKANGTVVEVDGDTYTVIVAEDTEIEIAVGREGMPLPALLTKLDLSDKEKAFRTDASKVSSYALTTTFSVSDNGYTWNFAGFNNNKWGWDMIKTIGKNVTTPAVGGTVSATFAEEITSIVVNASAISGCTATIKLEVLKGGNVIYTYESGNVPANVGKITIPVNAYEANCEYKLSVYGVNDSATNGGVLVYDISYYAIECDHAWGEANVIDQATCTTPGKQSQTCSNCENTKISVIPVSDVHSFMDADKNVTGTPVKAETAAGANELGNHAYYLCTVCNHYFAQTGAENAWVDLGEDADAALAAVRIHNDTHINLTYTSDNAGNHSVTCGDCTYTTTEPCDTNGEDNACSKCGYKNESATYVAVSVTYVVDGGEAAADAPANLELTWKDGEKNTLPTAPNSLECGKTYYISLNLNDKFTLVSVSIAGTADTESKAEYEIAVAAGATDAINVVVTVTTVAPETTTVALDLAFTSTDTTYAGTWNSSYASRELTFDKESVTGKIVLASANKQTSNITDVPVSKTKAMTISVEGKSIVGLKLTFTQWTTKALGTITLTLSDGTTVTGTNEFTQTFDLSAYDNITSISVASSDTSNQAGIAAVELIVK
ncbi:MAG: hypothetical protein NC132_04160 [Corallococcus sp.]|nr:hypothetical protein [Corallococcus sp.]MCM1359853.1 hypothetical protein [Corallococcus sp.]MCM1395287.1 hypothetical protein [Corallococcus sp.]